MDLLFHPGSVSALVYDTTFLLCRTAQLYISIIYDAEFFNALIGPQVVDHGFLVLFIYLGIRFSITCFGSFVLIFMENILCQLI